MKYRVTTIDVCCDGFERLRSQTETLLRYDCPDGDTTIGDLQEGLKAEIDALDDAGLPEGFDYGEATKVVLAAIEGFDLKNFSDIEPKTEGYEDYTSGPHLYVFLEVTP